MFVYVQFNELFPELFEANHFILLLQLYYVAQFSEYNTIDYDRL